MRLGMPLQELTQTILSSVRYLSQHNCDLKTINFIIKVCIIYSFSFLPTNTFLGGPGGGRENNKRRISFT
jgi:hypothetical protein